MARRKSSPTDAAARRQAIAQIRQFPDPVLRQASRPVTAFDDDLAALAGRMVRIMHDANGAGLAAPQLGILQRLFVYQLADDEEPVALVNPEIVARSDETEAGGEGCLSLQVLLEAEHDVAVERALRVTVRALDIDGTPLELEAEGMEARVIQHELDHLDGVLIVDRAAKDDRRDAMRMLRGAGA